MLIELENGKQAVIYDGKTLILQQHPHCEVPLNSNYQWMAHAKDDQENEYYITWQQRDGFDGEDGSEACDWDEYEIISLYSR